MNRKSVSGSHDIADLAGWSAAHVPGPGALSIDGTSNNDRLTGTTGDDYFDLSQGGNDTARGLDGNDDFYIGSALTSADRIIGGAGYDYVELSGVYTGLTITGAMLNGVEEIDLFAGGSYDLTLAPELGAGLTSFVVFAYTSSSVVSSVAVDGSALTTALALYSSNGDDVLEGGSGNDFLKFRAGGNDLFDGNGGFNRISFFGLTSGITIDMGSSAAQAIAGGSLTIRDITDASGTESADTFTGSAASNWFLGNGGNDTFLGLGGDDLLAFTATMAGTVATAATGDGGRGFDTLDLSGNGQFTSGVTFSLANTDFQDTGHGTFKIVNFEAVTGSVFDDTLTGNGQDNALYGADGSDTLTGAAGDDTIYGDAYFSTDDGTNNGFDGPRVIGLNELAAFADVLDGGKGDDALFGGGGTDTLIGGQGSDRLTGGANADTFVYRALADSTSRAADTILDFTSGQDRIDLSALDADATVRGNQAFHLGETPGRAGDIVFAYDAAANVTHVSLFVDGDRTADMTIDLTGNVALTAADFVL